MRWNCGDAPVGMAKEEMAAATPNYFEAKFSQDSNEFLAFEARKARHSEICWIPTSSS
jgi:hypothetical protein